MSPILLVRCPQCRSKNRTPRERIERGESPVCGKCRNPLPVYLQPVAVTDATFAAEVERSPIPVVLDLWAAWCGPCRALAPILDELASEMAGRLKFAKLDIEQNPQIASRFNVDSVPTLLVFQRGEVVDQITGLLPKPHLQTRVERFAIV